MQTAGASYRLLVLNVDGTLVEWERQVSPETLRALEAVQASGIRAMLATGRMYARALPHTEKIGAKAPLILYNGAGFRIRPAGDSCPQPKLFTCTTEARRPQGGVGVIAKPRRALTEGFRELFRPQWVVLIP